MSAAAFKEWQVIVEALGRGEQVLVLRKGGIAEGRGGFAVQAERFWLFPTRFHAQREKTKPRVARWFADAPGLDTPPLAAPSPGSPTVALRYFADVVATRFLTDWTEVARLDAAHGWSEEAIRERFNWSRPTGLHALVVRVHRLERSIHFEPTDAMAGCKSWIELPYTFEAQPSVPVLSDVAFQAKRHELGF